jgi:hypothetical protein
MGMAFFGREVEAFASFDRACLALLEALLLAYHLSLFDRERVQDNPGYHRFPSLIIIFSFCNLANLGYLPFFDIFPDFSVSLRHPGWASSVLKKWNSAGGQSLGKGQQFVSVQANWKSSISMETSLSIIYILYNLFFIIYDIQ